jgi:alpha-tubulin suppressor-like RCC1 family protein
MSAALAFVSIGTGMTALQISAGDNHLCALLSNHSVKCWGYSRDGELGVESAPSVGTSAGTMGDALVPVKLGTGRSAIQISAGNGFNCVVLDNHQVQCWGYNQDGELGIGDTTNRGATAGSMGDALPSVDLGTGHTALSVTSGDSFACAILDDHGVKCWGLNTAGQLGQGDTNNRGDRPGTMGDALPEVDLGKGRQAQTLTATGASVCAILDNGELKCWGNNQSGELGQDSIKSFGTDPGQMGDALPAVQLEPGLNPEVVNCGVMGATCCAVFKIPGTVKCWGNNDSGQLGVQNTENQGGLAGSMESLPFVDLGLYVRVSQVFVGGHQTCALLEDGTLKCWGRNNSGQLGQGDTQNRGDGKGPMGDALKAVPLL